jgi:peroxiredoxin
MIEIGQAAPEFELHDLQNARQALNVLRGKIVILNFWSAECTWCERVDRELISCLEQWKDQVAAIWIASNANETREQIKEVADERKLSSVLLDSHQHVADAYGAQVTPHIFVIDREGKLGYQGAWDDITFRQRVATRAHVTLAVEALLKGNRPEVAQTSAYGCALVRP